MFIVKNINSFTYTFVKELKLIHEPAINNIILISPLGKKKIRFVTTILYLDHDTVEESLFRSNLIIKAHVFLSSKKIVYLPYSQNIAFYPDKLIDNHDLTKLLKFSPLGLILFIAKIFYNNFLLVGLIVASLLPFGQKVKSFLHDNKLKKWLVSDLDSLKLSKKILNTEYSGEDLDANQFKELTKKYSDFVKIVEPKKKKKSKMQEYYESKGYWK